MKTKVAVLATVALAVCFLASSVQAAPFVNLKMVINGGANDGASSVVVNTGDVVNYKIVGVMATPPVANTSLIKIGTITYGPSTPMNMTSLVSGTDGWSTVRFSIRETAVLGGGWGTTFTTPALQGNFTHGASASAGTPVTNGIDYIKAEIGTTDTKNIAEVVLATGSFTVGAGDGTGQIGVSLWGDTGGSSGSIKINNGALVIAAKTTNVDSFYGFTPLTLTPEPGTMILLAIGGVSALIRRRKA